MQVAVVDLFEYVGQRGAGGEGQAQACRVQGEHQSWVVVSVARAGTQRRYLWWIRRDTPISSLLLSAVTFSLLLIANHLYCTSS